MGWCSATAIFDSIAFAMEDSSMSTDDKLRVADVLASCLIEFDWDCQCDSDYWEHPEYGPILGNTFEEN